MKQKPKSSKMPTPGRYFHPVVRDWFNQSFDAPTAIQRQAWPEIKKHRNTLIAAPTGSGKTLAAFLSTIDDLVRLGLQDNLPDQTQIVYISPLKALSNDIERNLRHPVAGILEQIKNRSLPEVELRVAVRTGDTTPAQRTAMIKTPPHILVSTPESLYILLTSENGRKMLSSVHTVIVDEIHSMVGNKRGSHLSLSLERLEALTTKQLVRIGLSATQKPIETVAQFLTGDRNRKSSCSIVDLGYRRDMELSLHVPNSPLTAVMSLEVWEEIFDKIEELISQHETTLIFVNTRRLAERMAHHLTERLGKEAVTAHHGSMSKEKRLDAEQRLKSGSLKALVATASLELGIDIGSVDLVCQISPPRSIATFMQRVGRSGHTVQGTPKGILFPLTCDELVECVALMDSVRRSELDHIVMPEKPVDILAQQIVAEVAAREWPEEDLYKMVQSAFPYRGLSRKTFDEIIGMLADGFTTKRGRRGAYLHHDVVNGRLRGRRGARLAALTSGGSIPDSFDYDVMLEPANTFIGTLNEDFAIESMPGDIFQLGNRSWRIIRIENGKVRVADAEDQPPTIPFWFGEAPGRSDELSFSVSRLREEISTRIGDPAGHYISKFDSKDKEDRSGQDDTISRGSKWKDEAIEWVMSIGVNEAAADQLVTYLGTAKAALGDLPSQNTLVLERFFDEAGDMHLVIHSPFGSRLNRAWGLALRKRFCRKFNFELQAAATEDAIILSLGTTHSFDPNGVFHYLDASTIRDILIQAMLDSPIFEVRWRWNASRALAIQRQRGSKRVPAQLQRMQAEDLIALIFPDQLACFENIEGEREIPDHPLVNQTIHDCLTEAMDIGNLEALLNRIESGKVKLVAKDLREPSPLAHEILNARPFAFLDDAPLEERRARAVSSRRWINPSEARELGNLDPAAIEAVRSEAWPEVRDADELHDALVLSGYLTEDEGQRGDGSDGWDKHFEKLLTEGRAGLFKITDKRFWIAVERLPQMGVIHEEGLCQPALAVPSRFESRTWSREDALVALVRGRMECLGPVTQSAIARSLGISPADAETTLLRLENEGFIFQGQFTSADGELEWCERRLLARIHRYTLQKLRREIEPVSSATYMQFLFEWHSLVPGKQLEGQESLKRILDQLEGFEAPAAAWEGDILPARLSEYEHHWLDMSCLSGQTVWGRFRNSAGNGNGRRQANPIKTTPIIFVTRNNLDLWRRQAQSNNAGMSRLSSAAQQVLHYVKSSGASFFDQIVQGTGMLKSQAEEAIGELVAFGALSSDSYTGMRALLVPSKKRASGDGRKRRYRQSVFRLENAGRWSLLRPGDRSEAEQPPDEEEIVEAFARILLKRYGVIFRKIVDREHLMPPWRSLVRVLRVLEARGEIRGGRFVDGVWGEQFALPEAVTLLRKIHREKKPGVLISLSASDPLNLQGVITPGKLVPSHYGNRILYENGHPVAILEGKNVSFLPGAKKEKEWRLRSVLIRRSTSPQLRAYLGRGIG